MTHNEKLELLINRIYSDKYLSKSDAEQQKLKLQYEKEGMLDDIDLFYEACDALMDSLVDAAEYREMYS